MKSLGKISDKSKETLDYNNHFSGLNIDPIQYDVVQKKVEEDLNEAQVFEFIDEDDGEEEILSIKRVANFSVFCHSRNR